MDEIIIVDTGSTDGTKSIVSQYTNQIFDYEWIEDFAAARNYAFSLANMEYIFWLDADDLLTGSERQKLVTLKENLDPSVDSVTMDYHLGFDEFGNVTFSIKRNRLVKRAKHFQWIGAVHEYLEVGGNILHSDIAINHCSLRHDSDRNLKIYEKRLARGEEFSPRDLYYYANELVDHQMYEKAIYYYEKFLATGKGWVEDNISACGKLADCYHELGNEERELESALRSFQFEGPRAEFCCRLGYHFLLKNELQTAIFWYKLATQLEHAKGNLGGFIPACSTWLPHLQLCVCYDRMGEYDLAYKHNEIARLYRPTDQCVLHNQTYLESILARNEPKKRVLIGSPVNQKPAVLREFLSSLHCLRQRTIECSYFFIDDNQEERASELLRSFTKIEKQVTLKRSNQQYDYIRNEITHYWNELLIWKVAEFKNAIIEHAIQEQYDYLFLIDSDLVLHPCTVEQLVAANKDIISEIFWTKWHPDSAPQPQVWIRDEYTQWEQQRGETVSDEEITRRYEQFMSRLKIPGVYEVGGLGGCTLISRHALTSGINFKPIKNLSFWGEDRHFCIRAAALGFSLYVDTHYPAYHIYRDADLDGVRAFKKETECGT